jgi:hypothetical protein
MQWLDCEQSEQDKRYVEEMGRSARERWQRMVEAEEKKCKEQQEEIRIRREIKEREAAAAREADRKRKRETVEKAGSDAMRKGKCPRCTQ